MKVIIENVEVEMIMLVLKTISQDLMQKDSLPFVISNLVNDVSIDLDPKCIHTMMLHDLILSLF